MRSEGEASFSDRLSDDIITFSYIHLAIPALAWLDWQPKGDCEAAKMFEGEDCL